MNNSAQPRPKASGARQMWVTEAAALAGRRLRHLARTPGRLVGIVMNPLVLMITVGYLFENAIAARGSTHYMNYLMAGVALQVGLASIGPTAVSVCLDVRGGLMDRFRSLPISRFAVVAGHAVSDTLAGLGALVVVALFGLLLGWRPHGSVLAVAAGFGLVAVFIFAMVWVGVAIGMVIGNPESIDSVGALVLVLFSFLSTSIFAARSMPQWIRPVVEWNPVSAVAAACRQLWGYPDSASVTFPAGHPGLVMVITVGVLLLATMWVSARKLRTA